MKRPGPGLSKALPKVPSPEIEIPPPRLEKFINLCNLHGANVGTRCSNLLCIPRIRPRVRPPDADRAQPAARVGHSPLHPLCGRDAALAVGVHGAREAVVPDSGVGPVDQVGAEEGEAGHSARLHGRAFGT